MIIKGCYFWKSEYSPKFVVFDTAKKIPTSFTDGPYVHPCADKKTQLNHHFLETCLVFKYRYYLIMKPLIKNKLSTCLMGVSRFDHSKKKSKKQN